MKKMIAVLAVIVTIGSGCASSYVAYQTNNANMRNVVKARAVQGGAMLSVDILGITDSYLQAWMQSPLKMTGATIIDAGTAYGLYELGRQQGSSSSGPSAPVLPSTINADIVIIGNQNNVDQNNSSGN